MTDEERKLALYCLKASSDYHSEVCEECIKYPNCDHTGQDDVTETIIKALEQESKTGHWIVHTLHSLDYSFNGDKKILICSECKLGIANGILGFANFCPNCGAKMIELQESEG